MKKQQLNQISGGMRNLLDPTPRPEDTQTEPVAASTRKKEYTTVCYNIRPELADKVRDIAYWDRKRINVVVSEALEQYIAKWDKHGKPND